VPQNNRAQHVVAGSNTLIMDAYNANPTSMSNAIRSFSEIPHENKWMILGAMFELGEYSENEHKEIARLASAQKGARVFLIGAQFKDPADEYQLEWYDNIDTLKQRILESPPVQALILVKGSRAVHLESVLAAFQ
jgi:UDP-N-acetylmuramoyl-tripeptide--D-alanyl-D-alanine ligase